MKFSGSDTALTAAVLLLSFILAFFYYRDVDRIANRKKSVPLGSVSFMKNTAARKASNGIRWERLEDNSTVYQGDTIRTAELAEAELEFDDGTSLDVYENSMLRLDFSDGTQSFELAGGAMHIAGGNGEAAANRVIKVGKSVVKVAKHSDVSLLADKGFVSLDVSAGAASVTAGSGKVTELSPNEELRLDAASGEAFVVKRQISPTSPEQGARFLSPDGTGEVSFTARPGDGLSGLAVELSKGIQFTEVAQSVPATVASDGTLFASASVGQGTWYWRVRSDSGELSPARRFSLLVSNPPAAIWPEDGITVRFGKQLPQIRFSWGPSPEAVAYDVEISRARDGSGGEASGRTLRTSLTSLTVQSPGEGLWYWRVIPVYRKDLNLLRDIVPSPFRKVSVILSERMQAVTPLLPAEGSRFEISKEDAAGLAFSWQAESEAYGYELKIYSGKDGTGLLASFLTDKPYINLDRKMAPFLSEAGPRYWNVTWKDAEGNLSPASVLRRFDSVDGGEAIRVSFPPDGYTAAASLVESVRFVWIRRKQTRIIFQLSPDRLFWTVLYEKEVESESLSGVACAPGIWYWRLKAIGGDGSVLLETEPRTFTVVMPFAAPVLANPIPGKELLVISGKSANFSWNRIDGAEWYSCKLFPASGKNAGTPVFARDNLVSPACGVPVGTFPDGAYRVVLQAFSGDSAQSTRIIGHSGEEGIAVRKLYPVELKRPSPGIAFDGITAESRGVTLEWFSKSVPERLSLSVFRNGVPYPVNFGWVAGMSSFALTNLGAGKYDWTLRASVDGVDISPKAPSSFTVLEIPGLPVPAIVLPADHALFDSAYFMANKGILFEWKPVKGATRYSLRIMKAEDESAVFRTDNLAATSYFLDDLSCLDKGNFTWEVTAKSFTPEGKTDRTSKSGAGSFTVKLPELTLPDQGKESESYE